MANLNNISPEDIQQADSIEVKFDQAEQIIKIILKKDGNVLKTETINVPLQPTYDAGEGIKIEDDIISLDGDYHQMFQGTSEPSTNISVYENIKPYDFYLKTGVPRTLYLCADVDSTVHWVNMASLLKLQPQLTAGDGIVINANNVISAESAALYAGNGIKMVNNQISAKVKDGVNLLTNDAQGLSVQVDDIVEDSRFIDSLAANTSFRDKLTQDDIEDALASKEYVDEINEQLDTVVPRLWSGEYIPHHSYTITDDFKGIKVGDFYFNTSSKKLLRVTAIHSAGGSTRMFILDYIDTTIVSEENPPEQPSAYDEGIVYSVGQIWFNKNTEQIWGLTAIEGSDPSNLNYHWVELTNIKNANQVYDAVFSNDVLNNDKSTYPDITKNDLIIGTPVENGRPIIWRVIGFESDYILTEKLNEIEIISGDPVLTNNAVMLYKKDTVCLSDNGQIYRCISVEKDTSVIPTKYTYHWQTYLGGYSKDEIDTIIAELNTSLNNKIDKSVERIKIDNFEIPVYPNKSSYIDVQKYTKIVIPFIDIIIGDIWNGNHELYMHYKVNGVYNDKYVKKITESQIGSENFIDVLMYSDIAFSIKEPEDFIHGTSVEISGDSDNRVIYDETQEFTKGIRLDNLASNEIVIEYDSINSAPETVYYGLGTNSNTDLDIVTRNTIDVLYSEHQSTYIIPEIPEQYKNYNYIFIPLTYKNTEQEKTDYYENSTIKYTTNDITYTLNYILDDKEYNKNGDKSVIYKDLIIKGYNYEKNPNPTHPDNSFQQLIIGEDASHNYIYANRMKHIEFAGGGYNKTDYFKIDTNILDISYKKLQSMGMKIEYNNSTLDKTQEGIKILYDNNFIVGNYKTVDEWMGAKNYNNIYEYKFKDSVVFGTCRSEDERNNADKQKNPREVEEKVLLNHYIFGKANILKGKTGGDIGGHWDKKENYILGSNNKIESNLHNFIIGMNNTSKGRCSYLLGENLIGSADTSLTRAQVIVGRFNKQVSRENVVFAVGSGLGETSRENALEVQENGDLKIKGRLIEDNGYRSSDYQEIFSYTTQTTQSILSIPIDYNYDEIFITLNFPVATTISQGITSINNVFTDSGNTLLYTEVGRAFRQGEDNANGAGKRLTAYTKMSATYTIKRIAEHRYFMTANYKNEEFGSKLQNYDETMLDMTYTDLHTHGIKLFPGVGNIAQGINVTAYAKNY